MDLNKINPHIKNLKIDHLYHLGLDTTMDLLKLFGDVRYVVFTLSNAEAKATAHEFAQVWYNINENNFIYQPIYKTERFHMYKIGLTLIISIGVGMPSLLISLNEITKLLIHSNNYDITFFKIGFMGGLGVNPGDVVISNNVVNGKFESFYESIECGETYTYSTVLDQDLANYLLYFNHSVGKKNVILGKTLSTKDFYDGQARLTGALPVSYNKADCDNYLNQAYQFGVKAIDIESLAFAGFCNQLNIQACVIGIAVVDRLKEDNIENPMENQIKHLSASAKVLARYIKSVTY